MKIRNNVNSTHERVVQDGEQIYRSNVAVITSFIGCKGV